MCVKDYDGPNAYEPWPSLRGVRDGAPEDMEPC